jgi:2-keto-4-pentenoate hydratase
MDRTIFAIQSIQRTERVADHFRRHHGVMRGGVDAAVAQQHLDDANVGAVFQQMGGEAVAQGVGADLLRKPMKKVA